MPTECSAERFDFGVVEGRAVEAAFDGGLVTSDAGALLLGATDRAIDLVGRFADCFRDHRRQDLIEHAVGTLIGQRVFGIALGYEDLNDHDELRHDPLMAVLAGKLTTRRRDCAPVAGKSTLNRLELSRGEPSRYHRIAYDAAAIEPQPLSQVEHAFTHFDLSITPLLVRCSGPSAVMEEGAGASLWYNIRAPARIGLPAPITTLLSGLASESLFDARTA